MSIDHDTSLLNRVVWSALTTRQQQFSKGGTLARRFDPSVSHFAASCDNSPAALEALGRLIGPDDPSVYLLQADEVALPDGLETEMTAVGVLMIETTPPEPRPHPVEIRPLGTADIPDMVALAELTKPGPFGPRTAELGGFFGVTIDGRLAAMAGSRLSLPGFTEVSGICTHPDFRGLGLASALSIHVAASIRARGDTPFLHAFADNHGAIALYRRLGYDLWREVNVALVRRRR